jgi:Kef-type K+ transport system membrane component KefB
VQVLNTPTGQLIIAAAVLDDVIALLLLTLLQPKGGHTSLLAVLSPAFASAGLMLTAGAIARWGMPHLLACLGRAAPPAVLSARGGLKDKYLLLLLLCLASIFVPLAHVLGASHLLGAFLAGLCCCTEPRLHAAWTKQVKRPQSWLLKLFFAATCG